VVLDLLGVDMQTGSGVLEVGEMAVRMGPYFARLVCQQSLLVAGLAGLAGLTGLTF
jgi:hypothetical protein